MLTIGKQLLRKPQGLSFPKSIRFFTTTTPESQDCQDDFFENFEDNLVKVSDLRGQDNDEMLMGDKPDDTEFNYEGRLADRSTESEYTTENLMTVSKCFYF